MYNKENVFDDLSIIADHSFFLYNQNTDKEIHLIDIGINTHLIKILNHVNSSLVLFKNFHVNYSSNNKLERTIDFSSIYILSRSVVECYLTFNYLFYKPGNDLDLRIYRFLLWYVSRLSIHLNIKNSFSDTLASEISEELKQREDKINELKTNKYFIEKHLNDLNKYNKWKTLNWHKMASEAKIDKEKFTILYSFLSSHVHTDFHSLEQIKFSSFENSLFNTKIAMGIILTYLSYFLNEYLLLYPGLIPLSKSRNEYAHGLIEKYSKKSHT